MRQLPLLKKSWEMWLLWSPNGSFSVKWVALDGKRMVWRVASEKCVGIIETMKFLQDSADFLLHCGLLDIKYM